MNQSTYTVEGMTCGHCVASVTEEVGKVSGVTNVTVDLPTKAVTVSGDHIEERAVRAAISEAGYESEPESADKPKTAKSGGGGCCCG